MGRKTDGASLPVPSGVASQTTLPLPLVYLTGGAHERPPRLPLHLVVRLALHSFCLFASLGLSANITALRHPFPIFALIAYIPFSWLMEERADTLPRTRPPATASTRPLT